jgi:hypothetical protein
MPYIAIPPPHERFVDDEGKVSEIWYRYLSENLNRINSVSTINPGTVARTTSGTEVNFTGVPPGANRVTISFNAVSISTPGAVLVAFGTTAGVDYLGYTGNAMSASTSALVSFKSTSGFAVNIESTAPVYYGQMQVTRHTSNAWVESHIVGTSTSMLSFGAGHKSLGAGLDRVSVFVSDTVNSAFTGGAVNIHWEF